MDYSSLYDLLRFLERGTRLHIGVLFFGSFGGGAFRLPHSQTIHDAPVCWEFKGREGGNRRCFRCRQMAIQKCLRERSEFGGCCVNGVYEYTRPVLIDGDCVAMIYVGNIHKPDADERLCRHLGDKQSLLATMEESFDEEQCRALGRLIESYIRALWERRRAEQGDQPSTLIENVRAYVAENLEYTVSLSDAAKLFHYHEQYLGRLFKRETGMCFSEYINGERVKRAAAYLSGEDSVISIAYRVGFHNVTYFNRVFKRYFGKTPTEYKKTYASKPIPL